METHEQWICLWVNREKVPVDHGPPHDQHVFNEYLRWLQRSSRLHIKGPYSDHGVEEGSEEDIIEDEYDNETRQETQPQRAPLVNYVVRNSNASILDLFFI
jgi:hypothetical protein